MTKKKTVLIADEDRELVKALTTGCQRLDLEVQTAFDGLTALTSFLFGAPDLLCLGANLAGTRGARVCDTIISDALRSTIPVIVLVEKDSGEEGPSFQDAYEDAYERSPVIVDARTYRLEKTPDVAERVEQCIVQLLQLEAPLADAVEHERVVEV